METTTRERKSTIESLNGNKRKRKRRKGVEILLEQRRTEVFFFL